MGAGVALGLRAALKNASDEELKKLMKSMPANSRAKLAAALGSPVPSLALLENYFTNGAAVHIGEEFVGRVTSSVYFPTELNRPCKAVAWVFGQEGLQHILQEDMACALEGLGVDGGFMYNRKKAGEDFYLIMCKKAALGQVQPATWDGVFEMLAQLHGQEVAEKVQQHRLVMEKTSFGEFEQSTGINWRDIRWRVEDCIGAESLAETGHEWYITLEKLRDMETEAVTAAQARNFLFVHLGLNQFFAGTGRTRPPSMQTSKLPSDFPGISEFLCPNVNLETVKEQGACLILKFDREADRAYLEWLCKLKSPEEANVTQYVSAANSLPLVCLAHGKQNDKFLEWMEDNQLPVEARKLFPKGLNIRALRQNPLTKRWTLYGQGKSGGPLKPNTYNKAPRPDRRALEQPEFDIRCPFCPGTEAEKTPAEVCRVCPSGELVEKEGLPGTDPELWLARAVRNKFPYFATPPDLYATPFPGEGTAYVRGDLDNTWTSPWLDHPIYEQKDAFGASEVIIESPKHNGQLAVATGQQTFHALRVLAARGRTLRDHSGCKQLAYFKQYGASAGGSLVHPHMQVHALPIVTGSMLGTLKQHQNFFKTHGCCAVERLHIIDVTATESPGKARLVRETEHFVASVPYAAYHKGRIVIAPRRHCQRFEDCTDAEVSDLAHLLQLVMAAVYRQRDDPHYHVFWETLPTPNGLADVPDAEELRVCFRWMLHVRAVRNLMGITNASGANFAEFLPEQVAQEYRKLIEEELHSPLRDEARPSERELLAQQLLAKEKEVAELKSKLEKMDSEKT